MSTAASEPKHVKAGGPSRGSPEMENRLAVLPQVRCRSVQSEQNEKRGNLDELNTEVAGKPAEPRIESSGNVGAEKPAEIITGKKKPIDHTAVAMTGEHGLMVDKAGADGMDDKLPKGYEP